MAAHVCERFAERYLRSSHVHVLFREDELSTSYILSLLTIIEWKTKMIEAIKVSIVLLLEVTANVVHKITFINMYNRERHKSLASTVIK